MFHIPNIVIVCLCVKATATTETYTCVHTRTRHDALPSSVRGAVHDCAAQPGRCAVRAWLLPLLLFAGAASAQEPMQGSMQASQPQASAVIGSKNFTESVIFGEIGADLGPGADTRGEHRRQLGGTRILWRALLEGWMDAYPRSEGPPADIQ